MDRIHTWYNGVLGELAVHEMDFTSGYTLGISTWFITDPHRDAASQQTEVPLLTKYSRIFVMGQCFMHSFV